METLRYLVGQQQKNKKEEKKTSYIQDVLNSLDTKEELIIDESLSQFQIKEIYKKIRYSKKLQFVSLYVVKPESSISCEHLDYLLFALSKNPNIIEIDFYNDLAIKVRGYIAKRGISPDVMNFDLKDVESFYWEFLEGRKKYIELEKEIYYYVEKNFKMKSFFHKFLKRANLQEKILEKAKKNQYYQKYKENLISEIESNTVYNCSQYFYFLRKMNFLMTKEERFWDDVWINVNLDFIERSVDIHTLKKIRVAKKIWENFQDRRALSKLIYFLDKRYQETNTESFKVRSILYGLLMKEKFPNEVTKNTFSVMDDKSMRKNNKLINYYYLKIFPNTSERKKIKNNL